MQRLDERTQVKWVIDNYKRIYRRQEREEEIDALDALDPEMATASQVAEIMGNDSWVHPRECDECGKATWDIVEMGGDPSSYDNGPRNFCEDCLRAGLRLLAKQ